MPIAYCSPRRGKIVRAEPSRGFEVFSYMLLESQDCAGGEVRVHREAGFTLYHGAGRSADPAIVAGRDVADELVQRTGLPSGSRWVALPAEKKRGRRGAGVASLGRQVGEVDPEGGTAQ